MKILANKNGFVLAHDEYYGDYCFGTEREIKNLSMPCNQYGTKKEIKAELERWKRLILTIQEYLKWKPFLYLF